MDEGWATIGESVISPKMGEPEDEGIFSKGRFERISGTDRDIPLITNTKLYDGDAYLANAYGKGGICYWVLQDMLGDSLYFKALHQYINDWHGKHPMPYDFFNEFNTATGINLNWFWQKWFFDRVYPDLSIDSVSQNGQLVKIIIINKGRLPLPVYVSVRYTNGHTRNFHYGADVWSDGVKQITITEKTSAIIKSITLGNDHVPDKFEKDNIWKAK
jgi:aminopeptidase N